MSTAVQQPRGRVDGSNAVALAHPGQVVAALDQIGGDVEMLRQPRRRVVAQLVVGHRQSVFALRVRGTLWPPRGGLGIVLTHNRAILGLKS